MANRKSMSLLTELEELNKRLVSINIALLAELADILCSVSFEKIGIVLERTRIWDPTEMLHNLVIELPPISSDGARVLNSDFFPRPHFEGEGQGEGASSRWPIRNELAQDRV
jgi:hypothetical protein